MYIGLDGLFILNVFAFVAIGFVFFRLRRIEKYIEAEKAKIKMQLNSVYGSFHEPPKSDKEG